MRTAFGLVAVVALLALESGESLATEQTISGRRMVLRAPSGDEATRSVVIVAKETATDIPALAGDPTAGGATLMLGVDAGSAGQVFTLDASGWTATPTGFKYAETTGIGAPPVKSVILRRTAGGKALLRIVLNGGVGDTPLDVVPPDPGSDAVAVLLLANGDAYCTAFGGTAGGETVKNTASIWKVRHAASEPECPSLCCSFGFSCTWANSIDAPFCPDAGGTLGFPGTVCDGATGGCVAPPAAVGNCCEFGGGSACFGGPGVQQPPCDEFSGVFGAAQVCTPTQGCVP